MTITQLASKISKAEGKKSQVKIGDIREILRVIINLEVNEGEAIDILVDHVVKAINKKERIKG